MKFKHRKFIIKSKEIPIFFACDDGYIRFMMVTMNSIIKHASSKYQYRFYVLNTSISEKNKDLVKKMETENVKIEFCDVSERLDKIKKKLTVRDYYSLTTYYRIFIPEMYPKYDKVIYIDSDTVVCQDIVKLYQYNIGDNYVGAVQDYLVKSVETYGEYAEKVLGISRAAYFNAGMLVINSKQFRKNKIKEKFVDLINKYSFVVAQDQDYLNILCQDKVYWFDSRWNIQMSEEKVRDYDSLGIVHYNLAEKPWHHLDCKYADLFWEYAKDTVYIEELKQIQRNFTEKDKENDKIAGEKLMSLALSEIYKEDNYFNQNVTDQERSLTRQEVIMKREQYEKEGRFIEDLEDDPPGRELMPDEIDYLKKNMNNRIRARYAFKIARWFMNTMIYKKQLVIKEIRGVENMRAIKGGAIITCNHFNAFDSFAAQIAYEKATFRGKFPRKKLFRIIKEGNYTSFGGFYGFLMRNCNTLPLSSNKQTMKKLFKAIEKILKKGHFILIYPEQSMWWNYRKPKPLRKGAYFFAVNNDVPIIPCFITMEDTDVPGEGGLPVQAYTINIAPPIYPNPNKKKTENIKEMMAKNAKVWKDIYEINYGKKLEYTCEDKYVRMYLD